MLSWGIIIGAALFALLSALGKAAAEWAKKKWFNTEQIAYGRSLAQAEKKQDLGIIIAAGILTAFVILSLLVFNTDLHLFADRAGATMKVLGSILIVGSFVWLLVGAKRDLDAKAAIGWILLLGAGIAVSCGFNFDYFGL